MITNYYVSAVSTSSAIDKDEEKDVNHDVEDNYHQDKEGDDEEDILRSPRNLRQPRFARLSTRCASDLN